MLWMLFQSASKRERRRDRRSKMRAYLLLTFVIALLAAIGTAGLYVRNAERAKAELVQCRLANESLNEAISRRASNTAALQKSCRRNQNARKELEQKLSDVVVECAIPAPAPAPLPVPAPSPTTAPTSDCIGGSVDRLLEDLSEATRARGRDSVSSSTGSM